YAGSMNTTSAALLALVIGALVGVAATWIALQAVRAREHARVQSSPEVPDGAHAVISAMDDAAVIVDASMVVVAASIPAELFGLVEGDTLPDDLRALARAARSRDRHETATLRLRRGVEVRSVIARAGAVTPRL